MIAGAWLCLWAPLAGTVLILLVAAVGGVILGSHSRAESVAGDDDAGA